MWWQAKRSKCKQFCLHLQTQAGRLRCQSNPHTGTQPVHSGALQYAVVPHLLLSDAAHPTKEPPSLSTPTLHPQKNPCSPRQQWRQTLLSKPPKPQTPHPANPSLPASINQPHLIAPVGGGSCLIDSPPEPPWPVLKPAQPLSPTCKLLKPDPATATVWKSHRNRPSCNPQKIPPKRNTAPPQHAPVPPACL